MGSGDQRWRTVEIRFAASSQNRFQTTQQIRSALGLVFDIAIRSQSSNGWQQPCSSTSGRRPRQCNSAVGTSFTHRRPNHCPLGQWHQEADVACRIQSHHDLEVRDRTRRRSIGAGFGGFRFDSNGSPSVSKGCGTAKAKKSTG